MRQHARAVTVPVGGTALGSEADDRSRGRESARDAAADMVTPDRRENLVQLAMRVLPVASVIVFLGIWQIVGAHSNPILFTTPTNVAKEFWTLLTDGKLLSAFAISMSDLGVGYGLAIVVGILVGIAMGRSRVIERILNPFVDFFQATPLIAVVPLIVIWFGIGFESRIVVTFMLALWSIIINTATGVKATPSSLIDVTRVYKLSRFQVISTVALPNAVPSIFAGLRIALGKALIGMVIAEMEVSVTGLGGMVITYGDEFRTADLLAAIVTASAVGVIVAILLDVIRRLVFPWTKVDMRGIS